MSENALYTDLSAYYDLMCADINYMAQSDGVRRIDQLFGNQGKRHLDLACGTGPHIRHFLDYGYHSQGLDLNQPMLDQAQARCPEALFSCQDMCDFQIDTPVDLITCFLYSIHYTGDIEPLTRCLKAVADALTENGVFCFNSVDKDHINNQSSTAHSAEYEGSMFDFRSGWFYQGSGTQQNLRLTMQRTTGNKVEVWQDSHPMVALSFSKLIELLEVHFHVQVMEHDYECLSAWDGKSGNGIFVCTKKAVA